MPPTITYLEFKPTSTPAVVKLYPVGGVDDTILATAGSIIQLDDPDTDETGRWRASFLDLTARDYQLVATEGGGSVVADERYTVTTATTGSVIQPWSEAKPLTLAEIAAQVAIVPSVAYGLKRATSNTIALFNKETGEVSVTVLDSEGDPVDLSAKTLVVYVESSAGEPVETITDSDIVIGGADDNVVTFDATADMTDKARRLLYAIRDAAAPHVVYAKGIIDVNYAPYDRSGE